MPDKVNMQQLFETMGEVKEMARSAKHAANNTSQKVDAVNGKIDALALVVAAQGHLDDHLKRLEAHVETQDDEIELLKADKLRREGAVGLVEWVAKHWPFTLLAIFLAALVAWANGKVL